MNNNIILTQSQAADLLSISENTLNALAYSGQIPYMRISNSAGGAQFCFNSGALVDWLPTLRKDNQNNIEQLKQKMHTQYPEALSILQTYNKQFTTLKKPKGYNLTKVNNKKFGFIYYVRYIDNGKLIPTRWSTHTNDFEAATRFAIENRDKLLSEYLQKKAGKKPVNQMYSIMKNYYEKDSKYQKSDIRRGRALSENARKVYHNSILQHFIPFLKKRRIRSLNEIDKPLLVLFQDHCMDKGLKPQTVNHYITFVSHVFDYCVLKNYIETNPCKGLIPLGVEEDSCKIRNCYNISELRGVFNKRWEDDISYLLCLMIYSNGMRNSEIDRMKVKDIIRIKSYRFINILKSKSRFGIRVVPLHDFVYNRLIRYIRKNKKSPDDFLFCQTNGKPVPRQWYTNANIELGKFTKRDKAMLKKENITFYSGRHFWKTMVNANDLGDVEEYFMGHKISNDVAKRYNHRDKQGQEKIVQKARQVFRILDNMLFISVKR